MRHDTYVAFFNGFCQLSAQQVQAAHCLDKSAQRTSARLLKELSLFHLADYAADLFGPPHEFIPAIKGVERLYGGDLSKLRVDYFRNINAPSHRDWHGFNVSYEVKCDSAAAVV